jgi:transposase
MGPSTEAVQELVRQAEVLHGEESGRRVTGTVHWRHVACTERLTSDEGHAKRGQEAMEDAGMLGACRGTAVPDHGKPSVQENACTHAWCTAHPLRARRCLDQPSQQPWANDMAELLLEITAAVEATPELAMGLSPPEREACAKR